MSWGVGRYSLTVPRQRPGAGFDGAELPMVRPAPPAETRRDPAPELRARHRHEALLAFTVERPEEIDPTPSSRPGALAAMGVGGEPEPEPEPESESGYQLSYLEENDNDDDRRGHGD